MTPDLSGGGGCGLVVVRLGDEYSSGEGRLYAEDVIVKIEGAAGTMIVSV